MLTKSQFKKRFEKVSDSNKIRQWEEAVASGDTLMASLLECVLGSRIYDSKSKITTMQDTALHTKGCGVFETGRNYSSLIGVYCPTMRSFILSTVPLAFMCRPQPYTISFGFTGVIYLASKGGHLLTPEYTLTDEGYRRYLLYEHLGSTGWAGFTASSIVGDTIPNWDWDHVLKGQDRSPILVARQIQERISKDKILELVSKFDEHGFPNSEIGEAIKHISNFVTY